MNGFPSNFVLETFLTSCRENLNMANIGETQRAPYMETSVYFMTDRRGGECIKEKFYLNRSAGMLQMELTD